MITTYAEYKALREDPYYQAQHAFNHLKHRALLRTQLLMLGVPEESIEYMRDTHYHGCFDGDMLQVVVNGDVYKVEVERETDIDDLYGYVIERGTEALYDGWGQRGRDTGRYHLGSGDYVQLDSDLFPPGQTGAYKGMSKQNQYLRDCRMQDRIVKAAKADRNGEQERWCVCIRRNEEHVDSLGMIDDPDYAWEEAETMLYHVLAGTNN